jgi:hypothetical protein
MDPKEAPRDLAQFAAQAIMERPGMSTSDLGAALGGPDLTRKQIDGLHRCGRERGFGQDGDGRWFSGKDSAVVMTAYLEARRTPGAEAFFAEQAIIDHEDRVVQADSGEHDGEWDASDSGEFYGGR